MVCASATLGAYSLVRFRYRGRESLAFLVLFTYLLPSVVLIIPLYLLMVKLGLSNTIFSLVIAYTTFALPYALVASQVVHGGNVPEDLESAALVDGATRLGAFRDVILPQLLPGDHLDCAVHLHPVLERISLRPCAGELGQCQAADHGGNDHADLGLQHRVVAADGRLGDDEPAAHR